MASRPGRAARAALAVAVVSVLAACSGIPTSGPVVEGAEVGQVQDDQFIRVIARPPAPGMSAEQVVQGFLEASASFQDDYAVARSYLTASASIGWTPTIAAQVYDGSTTALAPQSADRYSFTAPMAGTISERGVYSVAAPGQRLRVAFALARLDGEWRISQVPQGLLLSRGDLERGYRTFDLYYLDPSFTTLVPDPLTLRVSGPGLATTLVRELLRGATPWLAPAVRTAFPDGTSLAIDSVPVEGGIAQVALDPRVLSADERTREALSAQLVWTLSALPDITGVRITVGGQPLQVAGQGAVQSRDAWPQYDPDAIPYGSESYAVIGGKVQRLGPDRPAPVPGGAGTGATPMTSIAVSLDSAEVAGLSPDRRRVLTSRLTPGSPVVVHGKGADLASPGYARDGSLWWVDVGSGVRQRTTGGVVSEVPVSGVDATSVVGLRLARDGTRAAVVLRVGSRRSVRLMRVDRAGSSVRLADPVRVESRVADVVDVAWGEADRLVVLGSDGAGAPGVFLVDLGRGSVHAIGGPVGPRSLAAAPGRLVLLGADGDRIWQYEAGRWLVGPAGASPAYPG